MHNLGGERAKMVELKCKTLYGICYGDGVNIHYIDHQHWQPDRPVKIKRIDASHWCAGITGNWSNVCVAKHSENFYGGRLNSAASNAWETEECFLWHHTEPYGTFAEGLAMQEGHAEVDFGDDFMEVAEDEKIYINLFKGIEENMYSIYIVNIFYEAYGARKASH